MITRLALLCFALAAAPAAAQTANPQGTDDWRRVATPVAARALEALPRSWSRALDAAQSADPAEVRAAGEVLQPDARRRPAPPGPGAYRCRSYQLSAPTNGYGLAFVAYGWFRCRVTLSPGGDLRLHKLTGSQRPDGLIFPDDRWGYVFVGGEALGDDRHAPPHGADPKTDMIGVVQSLGPNHWRLVTPRLDAPTDVMVWELKR